MFNDNLAQLSDRLRSGPPIDTFVCCSSFEERSTSIAKHIDTAMVRKAVIAFNRDFVEHSQQHIDVLRSRFVGKCKEMELDTNDPIKTADSIADGLADACMNGGNRIVFDITSFTRESLLIAVKYVVDHASPNDSLEFLYANASKYSVGDASEDVWLSKGIREVRSILGYPGDIVPSKRIHLVVLVGFEDERALSLIRECEPSRISLGLGDEAEEATRPHQDTNVARLQRLKSVLSACEEFTFKGYDADATKIAIKEQIAKASGFNTIVAPMNTKISTLGAAAVALENESVQICYAQPNRYNCARYSLPGSDFYHFKIEGVPQ